MNPNTRRLHDLGQSLWLDNITRSALRDGTLERYRDEFSVTGLTSNPTIFAAAVGTDPAYALAIRAPRVAQLSNEELFFELALEDLERAADLFRPVFDATRGVDGWVSLEVSPLLADEGAQTLAAARNLWERAARANLFIKIPGTPAGIGAVEEATFQGIPVNVTLLFSREHYLAASCAWLRGLERRQAGGLSLDVHSVASLFVSRWDVALPQSLPAALHNRLGLAMAMRTYAEYRALLASARWRVLAEAGATPQRLLWASTGTKDAAAADTLYVEGLAAPGTINTLPEHTLQAYADHGVAGPVLPDDGGDAERVLQDLAHAGIDVDALAARLQREGVSAFAASWQQLLAGIAAQRSH